MFLLVSLLVLGVFIFNHSVVYCYQDFYIKGVNGRCTEDFNCSSPETACDIFCPFKHIISFDEQDNVRLLLLDELFNFTNAEILSSPYCHLARISRSHTNITFEPYGVEQSTFTGFPNDQEGDKKRNNCSVLYVESKNVSIFLKNIRIEDLYPPGFFYKDDDDNISEYLGSFFTIHEKIGMLTKVSFDSVEVRRVNMIFNTFVDRPIDLLEPYARVWNIQTLILQNSQFSEMKNAIWMKVNYTESIDIINCEFFNNTVSDSQNYTKRGRLLHVWSEDRIEYITVRIMNSHFHDNKGLENVFVDMFGKITFLVLNSSFHDSTGSIIFVSGVNKQTECAGSLTHIEILDSQFYHCNSTEGKEYEIEEFILRFQMTTPTPCNHNHKSGGKHNHRNNFYLYVDNTLLLDNRYETHFSLEDNEERVHDMNTSIIFSNSQFINNRGIGDFSSLIRFTKYTYSKFDYIQTSFHNCTFKDHLGFDYLIFIFIPLKVESIDGQNVISITNSTFFNNTNSYLESSVIKLYFEGLVSVPYNYRYIRNYRISGCHFQENKFSVIVNIAWTDVFGYIPSHEQTPVRPHVIIENSNFEKNKGTVIYSPDDVHVIVDYSIFSHNDQLYGSGSVISVPRRLTGACQNQYPFIVTNSEFYYNHGQNGGCIYATNAFLILENDTFIGNKGLYGGFMFIMNCVCRRKSIPVGSECQNHVIPCLSNLTVLKNQALELGGAIYIEESPNIYAYINIKEILQSVSVMEMKKRSRDTNTQCVGIVGEKCRERNFVMTYPSNITVLDGQKVVEENETNLCECMKYKSMMSCVLWECSIQGIILTDVNGLEVRSSPWTNVVMQLKIYRSLSNNTWNNNSNDELLVIKKDVNTNDELSNGRISFYLSKNDKELVDKKFKLPYTMNSVSKQSVKLQMEVIYPSKYYTSSSGQQTITNTASAPKTEILFEINIVNWGLIGVIGAVILFLFLFFCCCCLICLLCVCLMNICGIFTVSGFIHMNYKPKMDTLEQELDLERELRIGFNLVTDPSIPFKFEKSEDDPSRGKFTHREMEDGETKRELVYIFLKDVRDDPPNHRQRGDNSFRLLEEEEDDDDDDDDSVVNNKYISDKGRVYLVSKNDGKEYLVFKGEFNDGERQGKGTVLHVHRVTEKERHDEDFFLRHRKFVIENYKQNKMNGIYTEYVMKDDEERAVPKQFGEYENGVLKWIRNSNVKLLELDLDYKIPQGMSKHLKKVDWRITNPRNPFHYFDMMSPRLFTLARAELKNPQLLTKDRKNIYFKKFHELRKDVKVVGLVCTYNDSSGSSDEYDDRSDSLTTPTQTTSGGDSGGESTTSTEKSISINDNRENQFIREENFMMEKIRKLPEEEKYDETTNLINSEEQIQIYGSNDPVLLEKEEELEEDVVKIETEKRKRIEELENIFRILSGFPHDNVCDVYGWSGRKSRRIGYFMENAKSNLKNYVETELSSLSENLIKYHKIRVLEGVACGMLKLHSVNVIHSNLHPGVIYVNEGNRVKVGGLEWTFDLKEAVHDSEVGERCVSFRNFGKQGRIPFYTAPECFKRSCLCKKSDVYSFGVLIYDLLFSNSEVGDPFHVIDSSSKRNRRPGTKPVYCDCQRGPAVSLSSDSHNINRRISRNSVPVNLSEITKFIAYTKHHSMDQGRKFENHFSHFRYKMLHFETNDPVKDKDLDWLVELMKECLGEFNTRDSSSWRRDFGDKLEKRPSFFEIAQKFRQNDYWGYVLNSQGPHKGKRKKRYSTKKKPDVENNKLDQKKRRQLYRKKNIEVDVTKTTRTITIDNNQDFRKKKKMVDDDGSSPSLSREEENEGEEEESEPDIQE